jgi:hypothetical protein
MNNMKSADFLIVFALFMGLSACNLSPKPLDVDVDEAEQRLVISSFAIPPQEALFTITRTFSALLGEDSIDIDNQDVASRVLVDSVFATLGHSGYIDTLFKLTPGVFGAIKTEQLEYEHYVLDVKDFKTGQTIHAQTQLLPTVPLEDVYPTQNLLPQLNEIIHSFRYAFLDPPGIANYYLATYTNLSQQSQSGGGVGGQLFNFNQTQFNVFSDQVNGDGVPIVYQSEYSGAVGDTIVVALSNITKEHYNYMAAYKRSGNLFSQLTGEPINLPTNVEGGYGFFAMILPSVRVVVLE